MKFGKQIQSQQFTEWSSQYLDYKGLKKFISSLLNSSDSTNPELTSQGTSIEDNRYKLLQSRKAAFFFKLERELEKINTFYLSKENELKIRLRTLIDKKKVLQSDARRIKHASSMLNALQEAFVQFEHDLIKLQKYVDLNNEGFRKILKKWDKRSKSTTKELYLSRQIDVQPCFNTQFLCELADLASSNRMELLKIQDGIPISPPSPAAEQSHPPSAMVADVMDDVEFDLVKAVSSGQATLVREILERISQHPLPDDKDRLSRVFWHACAESAGMDIIDLLMNTNEVNFDFVDDINERSFLHLAAMAGRCDILKICAARCNVQAMDGYGRTALHYATMKGFSDCVSYLLTSGADIESRDHDEFSPLIYAIVNGQTPCVKILLDAGANFEPQKEQDHIPLSLACYYGHKDIAQMLFERGAKSLPNSESLYPLHLAARQGHVELCRLLAQRNDRPFDLRDKYNSWTPLFWAASEGHADCVQILIDAGCQISLRDEKDKSALYYAAWEGQMECVQLLIKAGHEIEPIQDDEHEPSASLSATEPPMDAIVEDELELDTIPSLSLPPPIIPFRIYGHSYLDRKYQVQVTLRQSPIRLYDNTQIATMKLIISPKPDSGVIPHNVILPLEDDRDYISFQVDSLDHFFLEFDLFPTFGSKLLGRGVALPHTFTSADIKVEDAHRVIPLLDGHLKAIGELSYDYAVVKPFRGVQLEIGGRIETYWKSTNTIQPSAPTSAVSSSHGTPDLSSPYPSNPHSTSLSSFITASSLSGDYVHIVVQLTKDGVPVVFSNWVLSYQGLELAVSDMSYDQFCKVGEKVLSELDDDGEVCPVTGNSMVIQRLGNKRAFLSLQRVLDQLPTTVGVHIEIMYPSLAESRIYGFPNLAGRNTSVDAILECVYAHVRAFPTDTVSRSIFFSSFNPAICTTINWKQPNYAVFFSSYCGLNKNDEVCRGVKRPFSEIDGEVRKNPPTDARCTSLKEAVKFAKSNNLLGIICEATPLVQVPSLIKNIKESGLVLVTFGTVNLDARYRKMQERYSVDAIMTNDKVHFTQTMAGT